MKGNRELDELLISYLLKELNTEDEAFVVEFINSDDNNRKHFEALQNTWRLLSVKQELDKIDINDEWLHFEQAVAREKQKLNSKRKQHDVETRIKEETRIEDQNNSVRRSIIKKILVSMAVAASIITLAVLVWNYSTGKEQQTQHQISKVVKSKLDLSPIFVRHELNNSGKTKRLVLEDGSVIMLSDKSEISYQQPFGIERRDITLKGKADFKVAKDKSKPLTVYSLALSTTALGTHFAVTAFENATSIYVRLYEGKVVVKSIPSNKPKYKCYLVPGQEFIYNNNDYTAKLLNFNVKHPYLHGNNKVEVLNDDPALPENKNGSWNMFNNQSLEDVFNQLKVLYNVDIVYSKRDVHKKYFIGKYDKSESVDYILNQIASLNNLKVIQKNNRYLITR